jgi:hypothetical protein
MKLSDLDLPFGMQLNSGPSATVPDSSRTDSERFSRTSPLPSQVIAAGGSAFNEHSWN